MNSTVQQNPLLPETPFLTRLLFSEHLVLALSAACFVSFGAFTPGLASPENLGNILSNLLPLAIAAVGQTFVLIAGGIDLSATGVIALASVTGACVMTGDGGLLAGSPLAVPAGLLAMLGVGAAVGFLNGTATARLGIPAFMVTLATLMFFGRAAVWLTQSESLYGLPGAFNAIGRETAWAAAVTVAIAAAAHVALSRSLFGRRLFAVGHNAGAAAVSGVPVPWTVTQAYLASGLCAAVTSILVSGRLESGSPVQGERMFLDVIGASVIGGTSLFGGKGSVRGTLYGALFLTVLDYCLVYRDCSNFTIQMAKGGVILAAALADALRARLRARGAAVPN